MYETTPQAVRHEARVFLCSRVPLWLRLFLRPLQTPSPEGTPIQPMQPLSLGARDQRIVRNSQKVLRHKPDGLLRGHPALRIKTPHMDGPGKSSQRPLSAQIEVHAEV